ncbi:hypothetical protein [Natrinema halophilum]|uniref:Uncharacterized protein n=1 Tax=Natrinema halophilum TaxID=1699371 RepID=A0A7D5GJK0_9EURY|nr:hypothetical protein [Natrinema halophilum]QLG50694.1 hypothetical protein HYG82_18560 [Natrinema halophilum]
MDLTIENAQVVVDYEGTDYAFEVVGENELEYAETSAPEATVPDDVLEVLETQGYIVYRE